MPILNMTQHTATVDQVATGIVDLPASYLEALRDILTLPADYTKTELEFRAKRLVGLAKDAWADIAHNNAIQAGHLPPDDVYQNHFYHTSKEVMVGGLPSLMSHLERAFAAEGFKVGYARTERVSVDQPQADGSTKKTAVFKHTGMYWVE